VSGTTARTDAAGEEGATIPECVAWSAIGEEGEDALVLGRDIAKTERGNELVVIERLPHEKKLSV
jgi:hypothetical protein